MSVYQLVLQHHAKLASSMHGFSLSVLAHSQSSRDSTSRDLRRVVASRIAETHADSSQLRGKILSTTAALERSHAAVLFARLIDAFPIIFASAFADNIFASQQLRSSIVSEGSLPQRDYVLRHEIRREHAMVWNFMALRANTHARYDLPARDVRSLTRKMRTTFSDTQQDIALLWRGDELLAKVLRSRCGLSKIDSRSWLIDRSADFI